MNTIQNIMVCVTQQKTCERLIRRGAEIRDTYNGELFVIHVAKEGDHFLGTSKDGDALDYLFEESKAYGANLTVVRAHDVLETLKKLTEKNNIDLIVLGQSFEKNEKNVSNKLEKQLPKDIEVEIVPIEKEEKVG
ncbi:universal stress protein [Marinisporobacter balticus]|uniref:Universal stress protein family protein n=1 Tax=Marinisporobacter balticus TaxID=2018667 RepID=A0A4R2KGL7_9FIRM|nr:universal stress protein [Marinisporobacter balticus]TCO72264.1 universal stress protein family protein [Marinisporobacter balticus]